MAAAMEMKMAAAVTASAGRAGRAQRDTFDSSAHEAALDDYREPASPALKRLSGSQANLGTVRPPLALTAASEVSTNLGTVSDWSAAFNSELETLDGCALDEKLDLTRSLRPGTVPLDLVSAQLGALEDIEEDIKADLAELDVIDLASEAPILSDAARRVMQFAQLSKFMKAGTQTLGATRRSSLGETIETDDFSIEDRRGGTTFALGGTVDFSIGDLHRLVLELPSVPVEKLRRELDILGDVARPLKADDLTYQFDDDDCLGRTMVKTRSAAVVAAARGRA